MELNPFQSPAESHKAGRGIRVLTILVVALLGLLAITCGVMYYLASIVQQLS